MIAFLNLSIMLVGAVGVLAVPLGPFLNASTLAPMLDCTEARGTPVLPSEDCFYRPPDLWEKTKPGTILRFRNAPGNPLNSSSRAAYNILYRTTDSNEKPTYAVTTVFVPQNISKPHAIVSYQHNYNSADINSSPSYLMYGGDEFDLSTRVPKEALQLLNITAKIISPLRTFVSDYLERGWFVNLPDFEGPLAAFGAGHMAGYATLDSVRATMSIIYGIGMPPPLAGDPAQPKIAMYGYSGGSLATGWAAELAAFYAPELQFAGAGVGGLFPNATDTFLKLGVLQKSGWGNNLRSAITGLATMHEAAQRIVIRILGATSWTDAKQKLEQETTEVNVEELLDSVTVRQIFDRDVSLGHHGLPRMPMLIHRNDADILSTTEDSQRLQDAYCGPNGQDANVYLHINPEDLSFLNIPGYDPHFLEGIEASGILKNPPMRIDPIPDLLGQMFQGTFPKGCQRVNASWFPSINARDE